MGDRVADLAKEAGLTVVERLRLDPTRKVPDDLAEKVVAQRAEAFVYAGVYNRFAVEVLQAVHAGAPAVRLYGTDHLAIAPELPVRAGAAGSRLVVGGVDPTPGSDVRAFERRFRETYGRAPHPEAILGYRAMRLVLEAIEQAGADATSRRAVIERTLRIAGEPQARFAWWRVDGDRLVKVQSPL
jgi:ABC-type branched-subunit amino acid transport system substrate-binding protein